MASQIVRLLSPRNILPFRRARAPRAPETLAEHLQAHHLLPPRTLQSAEAQARRQGVPLARVLTHGGHVAPEVILGAEAALSGSSVLDLAAFPADPRLIDAVGLEFCLTARLLPWRRAGATTVIAVAERADFDAHRAALTDCLGPVSMALAPEAQMIDALRHVRGPALARQAETVAPARLSCRGPSIALARLLMVAGLVALCCTALALPLTLAGTLVLVTVTALVSHTLLRFIAIGLALAQQAGRVDRPASDKVEIARWPIVSMLVPLRREAAIADKLIARLAKITYPPELLDICLVVDADDTITRQALAETKLPPWMRQITVPQGAIQTKPRALNYAVDFCKGSIIGIYDAEDAPAPDQITRIVQRFYERGPDVACLQGILDFYNREQNWLARCFTIDYASWFRVMLPGLQRLGWVIPLGGTTVFFRRSALEDLGRWDAHNVTEDADLGLRLARFGYRTEMVETVTEEEANCRLWPWIRQRARWMKGYLITYIVHMRRPLALWRDLGPWRFLGVQVLFFGTLVQGLIAPLLWTFWIALIGLPHPYLDSLSEPAFALLIGCLLTAEVAAIALGVTALRAMPLRRLRPWVPLVHVYAMLGSLAVWKAVAEFIHRPYHWDKTEHGHAKRGLRSPRRPPPNPA